MNRTFIIAEAGVNHNGVLATAREIIDAAVAAGADAVKFQTFQAEKLVTAAAAKAAYQLENTGGDESQFEMLRKLELSRDDHRALWRYAQEKDIIFMSTPFDEESADLLAELGMEIFKVGSGELTNRPLLEHIARKGRPMVVSTGMSYLYEVARAVQWLEEARAAAKDPPGPSRRTFPYPLVLLHCVTNYPAAPAAVNLRAMQTMKEAFHLPVGYSDHTPGMEMAVAAVALGAVVIEKHLTLSREMAGPDHRASLEPAEFAALVRAVRNVEAGLGDGIKKPAPSELPYRDIVRRSLVLTRDIRAGEKIALPDLSLKRPGKGIAGEFRAIVLGMRAVRDLQKDAHLSWEDLKNA